MTDLPAYFIGLMSGTSLDGIDGVLASFTQDRALVHRHAATRYPEPLKRAFEQLLTPGDNEIERMQLAQQQRNQLACHLVNDLCKELERSQVTAIADHGQTIRHCPQANPPYSLQLHDGAALAECSGIDSIVDFRSQDIAAGGQGAPLVPAFHQAFFAHQEKYRVIVNIGGIANISLLAPGNGPSSSGFDTGPGNTLLDSWCRIHTGQAYDDQGQWAASGRVREGLLTALLADAYFRQPPPKSTGRETFNHAWLEKQLRRGGFSNLPPEDVQASLSALTAHAIHLGIQQACAFKEIDPEAALEGIYLCGGGVNNHLLLEQIVALSPVTVHSTEQLGVPPQLVEATAFAWLGHEALNRRSIRLHHTTGARHDIILGAVYRSSS